MKQATVTIHIQDVGQWIRKRLVMISEDGRLRLVKLALDSKALLTEAESEGYIEEDEAWAVIIPLKKRVGQGLQAARNDFQSNCAGFIRYAAEQ